jgi:transposase InsO family protein
MHEPHASRLWNRSARACADISADSRPTSRTASRCGTITAHSICRTTSKREIAFLGIESSPAFVRAPEGNGCAERFIRTLKENLLWVRHSQTIEELRQALLEFRETYNATWLIERHGFMSPAEFRHRQLQPVAEAA